MRVGEVGKAILALNLGSVLALLRGGAAAFRAALERAYHALDAGGERDDVSRLLATYCRGAGIEVGPGNRPTCDPARTVLVDKFVDPTAPFAVQRIADAWALPFAPGTFDFLLSSHCLEHCPDTIGTLLEWKRVVRPGGYLVLILPHGERTFDRGRELTTLAHHREDHRAGVTIDDETHREEFERITAAAADHEWLSVPEVRLADGRLNWSWLAGNGHVHYHVWTAAEMVDVVREVGCRLVLAKDRLGQREDSFAVVAQVPA